MKIKGTYLLVLVATCGLIASGVGLVTNIAGLFFDPVATEIGVSKGQVSLMLTICNICFALGGMAAPALMRARSPKPLLIVATAALAASTAALSLCHGIWPMYALCVIRGLAAGVVGMVFATTVLGNWFVEGLGLVTSIAFGFSGIAGAILSPVMSGVIGGAGWRAAYVVAGVLTVLLNLPAILFLPAVDPAMCGQRALGAGMKPADESVAKGGQGAPGGSGAAFGAVLFALVLAYVIICSGVTALPQHFPGIAESFGVGAVGATMLVAAVLVGLCYSLGTVGISMTTRDVFGDANYTRVYPAFSLGGNCANAIFSSVIGYMYDFSGGYVFPLWVMLFMTIATAATIVVAYTKR